MKSLTMAWRNVWRNSRRTVAAVIATTLGLWAMIVYSGMIEGYLRRMEAHVLDVEMGDIQIHHPQYVGSPSIYDRIEDPTALLLALDEAGLPAAPRLLGAGLAAAGDSSAGVTLVGIDVLRDATVSRVPEHLTEGTWLDPAAPGEVVVGRHLAQMLGVGIGGEVVVLSQAADGSTANELYTVRGILRGVSDAVDRSGMYMTEQAFRELMVVPDGAHEIIVRRADQSLDTAVGEVRAAAPGLDTRTWRELKPTLASMLDSASGAMVLMFFIVYAAIAIVILNAMLMAVFERVREFGVLKAIGVSPSGVLGLIYLETLIQTGIAIVLGVGLAIPANWFMVEHGLDLSGSMDDLTLMGTSIDPIWHSHVTVNTYVQPVVALVIIVAIAVTYPALRAAFIKPITAMRHQ
ncbi:ABC transporter permease [Paraliomyxa miuraensis]|uniref:ABC transporter permease n=1 Tax=Paraliomyxa miuraensis TaxID=376150 RepID=UPI0022565D3B|nr:FtsX-like permease family protein [Paraliomyxa miuraensis]MCX4247098.1 FtsX-like permease family protein [Paraliomyxa miuraensis]